MNIELLKTYMSESRDVFLHEFGFQKYLLMVALAWFAGLTSLHDTQSTMLVLRAYYAASLLFLIPGIVCTSITIYSYILVQQEYLEKLRIETLDALDKGYANVYAIASKPNKYVRYENAAYVFYFVSLLLFGVYASLAVFW
jgi:hypothetical protein